MTNDRLPTEPLLGALERLEEMLHLDTSEGVAPEAPKYESGDRRSGSTPEVDFWTSKKVRDVKKSHLNYAAQDSKWGAVGGVPSRRPLERGRFVKNQGLGFAIPYLHNGQMHPYVADFIVRLDNGVRLVLETKGHDDLENVKTQAAQRWVRAVNAEGSFGEWRYEISHAMNEIPGLLDKVAATAAVVA